MDIPNLLDIGLRELLTAKKWQQDTTLPFLWIKENREIKVDRDSMSLFSNGEEIASVSIAPLDNLTYYFIIS